MTTLAAIAKDGQVWMAADSMTTVYDRPIPNAARKIRRLPVGHAEALIGVCGDGGLADLLTTRVTLPSLEGMGDLQIWAAHVAYVVTDRAIEAGLTEDGRVDGHFLLGHAGQLWTLIHAQAIPHPDGIAALGSGEALAIGAIDALEASNDPVQTLGRALQIACHRDRYSAGPVYVELV